MKNPLLFIVFSVVLLPNLFSQNVGIGTSTPVEKLHVAGSANGLRIDGLSTTGTFTGNGTPLKAVFVDANGSLVKGGSGTPSTDAWYTIGNSGTTAGINFIGTTDAQAFVFKTGGAAAANERMRILATGPVVYNNTTPFAGDVFSVYGNGYTGATNALGNFAINGYVGAGGVALFGESNGFAAANNGIGVLGSLLGASTATGTGSYGVYGENLTTPAGTGIAFGVNGIAAATAGDARGVNGQTASAAGIGVSGFNTATTGNNAYGVYGQTASNQGIGVFGINANAAIGANTAVGVFGRTIGTVSAGGFSIGVRAYSNATTGPGYGFYGQALSSSAFGGISFVTSTGAGWQGQNAGTGDGVRGINTNLTAATAGSGVYGQTNAITSMAGEFFNTNALGTGVLAVGNNVTGGYLARGSGIAATGTQFGVVGFATTTVNTNPLNNAPLNAAGASAGGYFEVQNAGTAQTWSYVAARDNGGVLRKIIGAGTVNTIVKDLNDNYVALSCPEAPENLFQDFGVGQLVNGNARIDLDPILAKNIAVDATHPLKVFVQLEGDCNGVYVTNKSKNGFDVVELAGGKSNTSFSWSIVANRADEVLPDGSVSRYSADRFAPAPGPQSKYQPAFKNAKEGIIQQPLNDIDKLKLPQPAAEYEKIRK